MTATPAQRFMRQTIKVQGEDVSVAAMEAAIGHDLSSEMDRVAAQLAYWGAVEADAKAEATMVDAYYRKFRADYTLTALQQPKASEWKIKALIEASPRFLEHKQAIAASEKNLVVAQAMVRAYEKKANALQSKGARQRAELGAQGMTTPAAPKERTGWDLSGEGSEHDDDGVTAERRPSREEKIKRMEQINNSKRAKKRKRKE